jgi:two-component system nitrogen regulation sensor histidine kinase NtrY
MATNPVVEPKQNPEVPSTSTISRPALAMLIVGTIVVSLLIFSQTSLNLSFLGPESLSGTLVLVGMSALIFLLFVTLTFMLLRNLLKLFAERRLGVLGSAFRTRMVVGGLVLSFLPVIFMFLFAYVLMNHSIDKWFSRPVEELREDSAQVAGLLSSYAAANAQAEALTLSGGRTLKRALTTGDFSEMKGVLERQQANLQGGFSMILKNDQDVSSFGLPAPWAQLKQTMSPPLNRYVASHPGVSQAPATLAPNSVSFPFRWNSVEYLVGTAGIGPDVRVVVGMPLPASLAQTLERIDTNQKRYYELATQRRQVRRFYMQLLLLITVLVLFASSWLSLFMARLVTRPVAALAEATKEISEGNLEYRVQVSAADELGELIRSFNAMAGELESNRREIDQSRRELASTNVALSEANTDIDQRRSQIETILENIPTGVLSLDSERHVTHSNHSFQAMFSPAGNGNATLRSIFDANIATDLEHLLRRSDRMGTSSREMQIKGADGELNVEVTVASLQHDRHHLGYVIVFEDLSDLLKAQKQVAWREVARRVAHEIKNPLTPIALSAERIRRHLDRTPPGIPPDSNSLAVIHGCAETISGAVETMRTLVDEFATLARFPTAQPQPTSINHIVDSALDMFNGRLEGIRLRTTLAPGLPPVLADPDSIKRVVANLVDNAAEATQESMLREIHISTDLVADESREMVEISVSDTGHGVTSALREKLFLPYFSTKDRGTGLGLAIVSRIVEEHHGSVRVEENTPVGARFVVELPVAPAATNGTGQSEIRNS